MKEQAEREQRNLTDLVAERYGVSMVYWLVEEQLAILKFVCGIF